jgi:CDI immunity protein
LFRISNNDELYDESLYPLIGFFNAISTSNFVRTIKHLAEGISVVIEYNGCYFPTDLELGEDVFEGVKFSEEYLHEEIIVSHDVVYRYMAAGCEMFAKEHPELAAELCTSLENFAKKFGVQTIER